MPMSRKIFLTLVSLIALAIGAFALFFPMLLLDSKGVAASAAAAVWVREVGVAIVAAGVAAFLLRDLPDSPALRAFLIANVLLQLGLFPIELLAYHQGVITKASGVVPNSILHLLLAFGFGTFAARIRPSA
jgi:hypothetical protein